MRIHLLLRLILKIAKALYTHNIKVYYYDVIFKYVEEDSGYKFKKMYIRVT